MTLELDPGQSGDLVEEGDHPAGAERSERAASIRSSRRSTATPATTCGSSSRGAPRASAVAAKSCRPDCGASSRSAGPGAHQRPSREAPAEHQPRDLELRRPRRDARSQRHAPGRLRLHRRTRCSTRSPTRRRTCARLLQELPSTLEETRSALASGEGLGRGARPGLGGADPGGPGVRLQARWPRSGWRGRRLAPIRDQIRPFTRQVRPPLRHLRQGAGPLGETVTSTARTFSDLNRLFNAWAYNPPGGRGGPPVLDRLAEPQRQQHGPAPGRARPVAARAGLQSCLTATRAEELAIARPFIWTLQRLTEHARSHRHLPPDAVT